MADDRYDWLDEDAAERLLSGEPAGALPAAGDGDPLASARARRLSAALAAASDPAGLLPAPVEDGSGFPGETAVLAAFREARTSATGPAATGPRAAGPAGRTAVRTAGRAAGQSAGPVLGEPPAAKATSAARPVTVRRPAAGPGTRAWFGRPLWAGLAVALTGGVLGGVAVAAGAGVLPTPFHSSTREPGPGDSVSMAATATPAPYASGSRPSESPDGGGTPGQSPGAGGESGRSPGDDGSGGTGSESPEDGGRADTGEPVPDELPDVPVAPGDRADERVKAAIELCRKYKSGRLDRKSEKGLEKAAGGSGAVGRYCGGLLAGAGAGGTGSGGDDGDGGHKYRDEDGAGDSGEADGSSGDEGGDGSGDEGGDGSGDEGGDGSGGAGSGGGGTGDGGTGDDTGGDGKGGGNASLSPDGSFGFSSWQQQLPQPARSGKPARSTGVPGTGAAGSTAPGNP